MPGGRCVPVNDRGFTLVEVLVAALIGFLVLSATLGLLESTTRLTGGVMSKTDAMQRGRLAMDVLTRQLRSQVCAGWLPAIVDGRADRVTFHADFGDGSTPPDRRVVALEAGGITERVHRGAIANGTYTFAATPERTATVLENAVPAAEPPVPFLRYYAFDTAAAEPAPVIPLNVPLSPADRARVARIEIAFAARPTGARDNRNAIELRDQVTVRHADPDHSDANPTCA